MRCLHVFLPYFHEVLSENGGHLFGSIIKSRWPPRPSVGRRSPAAGSSLVLDRPSIVSDADPH